MAPSFAHLLDASAIAAAWATWFRSARTAGLRAARTTGAWSLARTITGGAIATRAFAIGVEATRIGVVGREVWRVARMSIWTCGTCRATFAMAWAVAAFATRPAITGAATWATVAIGTWATRTRTAWAWATGPRAAWATRTSRFVAIGFARAARPFRVAMAGRTGIHAIRNEPGAHRSGILATLLARAQLLALRTRALGLERFL